MAQREGLLPFKLIEDETGEALTSYSGLPLVLETCEALGLARLVKEHVRIKQRQRGFRNSDSPSSRRFRGVSRGTRYSGCAALREFGRYPSMRRQFINSLADGVYPEPCRRTGLTAVQIRFAQT